MNQAHAAPLIFILHDFDPPAIASATDGSRLDHGGICSVASALLTLARHALKRPTNLLAGLPVCHQETGSILDHTHPVGLTARRVLSGDDTCGAPPVPIPNTAVKPAGPMIVPLARKSVIAGFCHFQTQAPVTSTRVAGAAAFRIEVLGSAVVTLYPSAIL